jgi:hypothetical protein
MTPPITLISDSDGQGVPEAPSRAYTIVVAHRFGGVRRCPTVTTSDPA